MYQGNQPLMGRFSKLDDISSQFNSSLTTFNLLVGAVAVVPGSQNNLIISMDGVLQEPGIAYTTSGSTITFTEAVPTGTQFFGILLGHALTVGTPSDGSVDSTKLATLNHIDMNVVSASSNAVGRSKWNDTIGVMETGLKGGNTIYSEGLQKFIRVRNATGSTISKGAPVYINGQNGTLPTIALTDADSEATSSAAIGLASESIANGADGFVINFGMLNGLNTSSFTAGNLLWVSSTTGALTTTRPAPPAHAVFVGTVITSHASTGVILVDTRDGPEIDEMHDVLLTSKTDKDVLQYESATGLWKNVQKGLGGDATFNGWLTKDLGAIKIDKGTVGTGTVTFDYTGGSCQRLQVSGSLTIAFSNWPPTTNLGVMQIELVNGGSATVTWPTINWIQKDGTFTTSISTYLTNISRNALQTSGTDFFVFWTSDAGTTIYGKIM